MNRFQNFKNGLLKDNPVFSLYLGICSTLAITTSVNNGLGMGVAVICVLIMSNVIISLVRNITPEEIRIPVYIVIIATLVKIIQMLIEAYAPALNTSLGVFIPLIVVNCIILGRAEAFASKHGVLDSALDGLGMGLGYTLAVTSMSLIREVLNVLLGEAPDSHLVKKIDRFILKSPEVLGVHDLMIHNYGPNRLFASAHVEVDASDDIFKVHDAIDNIEREIKKCSDRGWSHDEFP